MKTEVFTLPAFWACAIVNGDLSGMDEFEIDGLDLWLQHANEQGYGFCVDVSQESFFCKQHDASGYVLACDCLDFTFEVTQ
jgi:hypothetical protein